MRKRDTVNVEGQPLLSGGAVMTYTDANRGVIQDQEKFHRRILFDGIRFGKCMPTDIDAALEFGNKVLILYEVKYGKARVPYGQSLILQRLIDAWATDGKQAVLFICWHTDDSAEDVHLKDTFVTSVYYKGKWHQEKVVKNALDRTREFLDYCETVCGTTLQLEGLAEDQRRIQA